MKNLNFIDFLNFYLIAGKSRIFDFSIHTDLLRKTNLQALKFSCNEKNLFGWTILIERSSVTMTT